MNPYAGNQDSYPATVPLPDDSDPPKAASFNPAPQGIADRTAAIAVGFRNELADLNALAAVDTTAVPDTATRFVKGLGRYKLDKTTYPTFTEDRPACVAPTTGTGRWFAQDIAMIGYVKTCLTTLSAWIWPPNITECEVECVGGGGSGGGGATADVSTSDAPGGGGGRRGERTVTRVLGTPDASYDAIVGNGGAGVATDTNGNDGASSGLLSEPSTYLAKALGGQGGSKGALMDLGGGAVVMVPGGTGPAGTAKAPAFSNPSAIPLRQHEGDGGSSVNSQAASYSVTETAGASSANGKTGGAAGARGTTNTHQGGGGGGGGGAGWGGNGGNGGAGGNGDPGTANTVGGAGVAAGANSGGGGGGGGGGGAGTAAKAGGASGAGGSGYVIIRAVR